MPTRQTDLIIAGLCLAVGTAVLLLVPHQISGETLAAIGRPDSPAFFPILAGCILMLCGALLGVQATVRQGAEAPVETRPRLDLVLAVMVLFVLYLVAIHYLGMAPASLVAIVCMSWVLGFRDWRIVLATAVALPAAVYYLFERVLHILLPSGVLF